MKVHIQQADWTAAREVIARTKYSQVPGTEHTLWYCFNMSNPSWIGLVENEIACVWGLIPPTILSTKAYLWLLTTDLVDQHKFTFVRQSQIFVKEMLKQYPLIVGHAEAGNDRAIRWLKWLGAKFGPPDGRKIPFEIT